MAFTISLFVKKVLDVKELSKYLASIFYFIEKYIFCFIAKNWLFKFCLNSIGGTVSFSVPASLKTDINELNKKILWRSTSYSFRAIVRKFFNFVRLWGSFLVSQFFIAIVSFRRFPRNSKNFRFFYICRNIKYA